MLPTPASMKGSSLCLVRDAPRLQSPCVCGLSPGDLPPMHPLGISHVRRVIVRIQLAMKSCAKEDTYSMGVAGPAARNASARRTVAVRIPRPRRPGLLAVSACRVLAALPLENGVCVSLHNTSEYSFAELLSFQLLFYYLQLEKVD